MAHPRGKPGGRFRPLQRRPKRLRRIVRTTLTTIDVASGKNATINVILSSTTGLTKQSNGTLTLGGANNFQGTVAINAGTLAIDAVRAGVTAYQPG